MKKFISVFLALTCAAACCSCQKGRSIPADTVKQNGRVGAILSDETVAYTEKIEYYTKNEPLAYEIYYETAQGFSYTYNIAEKIGNYTLYIREGNVYAQKDGEMCIFLFSNPAVTYAKYLNKYVDPEIEFPLDKGKRYQISSNSDGDFTYVSYYANVTPQMASEIYSVNLSSGDKIISSYKIDAQRRIYSVEYSVEERDGKTSKVALRTFEYYTEKQNVFSSLPKDNDTVTVSLIMNGSKYEYEVPRGVYVCFEDGNVGYGYYTDENFTREYKPSPAENMTVYVKTNFE